ncbi:MAG: hypothetical protein R2758_12110 [Bacteroidales bacterium]
MVCSDQETIELVDARWPEYGLGPVVESPSLRLLPLVRPGEASVETSNVSAGVILFQAAAICGDCSGAVAA